MPTNEEKTIPMIPEEQRKQSSKEQRDFEVNMNTENLSVKGFLGTWHTVDSTNVGGMDFFLMKNDTYADMANIVVDSGGRLVLDNVYDGLDEHTTVLLRQEVMTVPKLPDETISVDEMKSYGYSWGGMLPMNETAALEVMQNCNVFLLYADNTESMATEKTQIAAHAAKGGIFGVEKVEWIQQLEKENYLKYAEMSTEDDYGMIDGIINNGKKDEKAEKPSIIERLKAAKTELPKAEPERAVRDL